MKKINKAYLRINDTIDDRYKKLSDKYHELELSHNRKKRILQKFRDIFYSAKRYVEKNQQPVWLPLNELEMFVEYCDLALFCDGRERSGK